MQVVNRDRPRGRRNLPLAIAEVAQEPSADAQNDRQGLVGKSKGHTFISAFQLVTGVLAQSTPSVPQIGGAGPHDTGLAYAASDQPQLSPELALSLADKMRAEKRTMLDSLTTYGDDAGHTDVRGREKKEVEEMPEITSDNLAFHVDNLLEKEGVSAAVRERLQHRITYYQNGQYPVFVIQNLMEEIIVALQGMARIAHPDASARNDYHSLYFALRLLWTFTKVFHDEHSKSKLDQYKAALQQVRWRERDNNRVQENGLGQPDDPSVADYLYSKSQTWREQRLTGRDNIVFHNDKETRMFSIAEVLDGQYLEFLKESESGLYFHFQYDNSGLRDPDLVRFVRSAANLQLFINFRQAPRYLPDGHYKIAAKRLIELHLQQIASTPLNFNYVTSIERSIARAAELFSPEQRLDRATKETIAAVRQLTAAKSPLTLTKKVVHAYACGYVLAGNDGLFGELDREQVLDSDYVYRYLDDEGKSRSGVTSLDFFLCRGARELHSDIGMRKGVNVLWPEQFSAALIAYLNDGGALVNAFASKVAGEVRLIGLERDLARALPSLMMLLKQYAEEVGSVYGIEECDLSDEIEFTYEEAIPLPLGKSAMSEEPVKKFTVMQILLGAERSWRMIDAPMYVGRVTGIPDRVSSERKEDYLGYIKSLTVLDAQDRLLSKFKGLKQNADVAAWFNEYVDIATADIQVSGVPRYEFTDTPLLHIFPVRNPDVQEWEEGKRRSNPYGKSEHNAWLKDAEIPFYLVSLVSRKVNYFTSYADMISQLSLDTALAAHIKAHFSVGYASGFNDLELSERRTGDDFYARRIDWMMNNFDRIIKSSGEATVFALLEAAGSLGFVFGEVLSLFHPKLAFLVSAASVSGSKLMQGMLVATRPDEQKKLVRAAILGLLEEMTSKVVEQIIGVYGDKRPDRSADAIDEVVRQRTDWILDRYFFNTTTDWK